MLEDGVDAGRDEGNAEVADDELRTEVATGACDEGAVTWLPSTAMGVVTEEPRDRVGVGDGCPATLGVPSASSVGSAAVLDAGSTEVVADVTVVLVVTVAAGTDCAEESDGAPSDWTSVDRDEDLGNASLPVGSCLLSPTWLRSAAFAAAAAPETMTTLQIVATISSFRRDCMRQLYEASP
jgi:hypothetical protein